MPSPSLPWLVRVPPNWLFHLPFYFLKRKRRLHHFPLKILSDFQLPTGLSTNFWVWLLGPFTLYLQPVSLCPPSLCSLLCSGTVPSTCYPSPEASLSLVCTVVLQIEYSECSQTGPTWCIAPEDAILIVNYMAGAKYSSQV